MICFVEVGMTAQFIIDNDGEVQYTDGNFGALLILENGELWYSFRHFDNGRLDVDESIGYQKATIAYAEARRKFT